MKLSDVSPLAGMLTGEGAMGKLIGKGFGGILPAAIARRAQKDAAEEERQKAIAASAQGQGQPMKKGGKVSSASSRADGCAQRGKTKGRMV
jgi:hypothetical protein